VKSGSETGNIKPVNDPVDDATYASDYRPHCWSSAKFAAGI